MNVIPADTEVTASGITQRENTSRGVFTSNTYKGSAESAICDVVVRIHICKIASRCVNY